MALAVLTPLLVMLAMLVIGHIQNRDGARNAQAQARIAVDMLKRDLAAVAKDNAHWDGAYRSVVLSAQVQSDWLYETWGAVTEGVAVYDQFYLLGPKAQLLYAVSKGNELPLASAPFDPELQKLLQTAQGAEAASTEPRIFFALMKGVPVLLTVVDIQPTDETLLNASAAKRSLMFVRVLDSATIKEVGQRSGLGNLRFRAGSKLADGALDLLDGRSRSIGQLHWQALTPGSKLMQFSNLGLMPILWLFAFITWRTVRQSRADQLELVASEARAHHLANHDGLTSLPNRRAFAAYLTACLQQGNACAVLYVDLDGFKLINDSLSHDAGDAVLKDAGARLGQFLQGDDMLARLGGDEFALLTTGAEAATRSFDLAQAVIAALERPFEVAGLKMHVGASVGIAHSRSGTAAAELMRQADIAMYAVKGEGKNGTRLFDPAMDEGRTLRTELESELRAAVDNEEIHVVYQPIVSADDHRIMGVEALARWHNPQRGPVGPDMFIPVAESSGLIIALGRQVLRTACRDAKHWGVNLAVNLSPAQLRHAGIVEDVQAILAETGFPPHRLELELTEGVLIQSPEVTQTAIVALRKLGIRISLDDFGTGYASIGYLRRFSLDKLKIDRSFVDRVAFDYSSASMTNAIIALANALSLPITAEGVENKDQATILRIAGCHQFQGWLFGKPMSAELMSARLAQQSVEPLSQAG